MALEDKIDALLRKAEATDNEHERDAFNAKAAELMIRAGIEEAEIRARRTGQKFNVSEIIRVDRVFSGVYCRGFVEFAGHIALGLGGIRIIKFTPYGFTETGKKLQDRMGIAIIGFENDVRRFETLLDSLEVQALSAVKAWWSTHPERKSIRPQEGKHVRRSFIMAFGSGARVKIADVYGTAVKSSGPSTELALRDRDAEIQDWISGNIATKSSAAIKVERGSWGAGFTAGRNADVGSRQQVES